MSGRRPTPLPKCRKRVAVPALLREFLVDVHRDIRTGGRDNLDGADDQFQCRYAYGGRDEDGRDYYLFTYFPTTNIKQKWELRLHRTEVEDIADGVIKELSLWCCQSHGCRSAAWCEGVLCQRHDYGKPAWEDLASDPGRRVDAIKAYREEHSCTLSEAAKAVDAFKAPPG